MELNKHDKSFRYFLCFLDSKLGRKLRRTYMVYADGTITNTKGRVIRRKMTITRLKSGEVRVKTQIKLGGRKYTYNRVVYKAWNPDFVLEDISIYVVPANGNPHDHRPNNLTTRSYRKVKEKILNVEQVKEIKEKYATGDIAMRPLADEYGVSLRLIQRVVHNEY